MARDRRRGPRGGAGRQPPVLRLLAEGKSLLAGDQATDEVVAERVRSKIGRIVSHPRAIEVAVHDGRVTLSRPVLAREVDHLLEQVTTVRGVTGVENRLEIHPQAGAVAGLQGGRGRPGERSALAQASWSPTTRLLAGAVGGALFAYGLTERFPIACVLGTVGLGLMARAATNLELGRLLGVAGGRRAVRVQKTFTINAPPDRVFRFWADYGNFPRFMAHLKEVRNLGGGRSHWVAVGPAGWPVTWNAVVTRFVPNEILAWQSEPGSVIANAGVVRFEPAAGGATRVDIRLTYNPPAGALGHFAATLFGADPKSAMDEDLVRLKSLLEAGKTSAPGKKATRDELAGVGQTSARS